jgi:triphosphoribosyl-dephospho-CoA synthase
MVRIVNEKPPLSIGMCAQLACVFDVVSYKPGNVSLMFFHGEPASVEFLLSAAAIASVMEQAPFQSIGQTILESIRATRRVVNTNTNLGIVLLLAPLASVPPNLDLKGGLIRALIRLTVEDARAAYEAIRLAQPGGLGTVEQQDVVNEPTVTLREAMGLAADRDMVARQYVNDFEQVFEGATYLQEHLRDKQTTISSAVQRAFVQLLAKYPDSLISRKYGREVALRVTARASEVANSGFDEMQMIHFDSWLRHGCAEQLPAEPLTAYFLPTVPGRPNPGATADLVTASLFVALRRGMIELPRPKLEESSA